MLAAMMAGGGKYANQVALTTSSGSWFTVPSGVTTVYLNVATAGVTPSPSTYPNGGGGGAALLDCPITVTPTYVLGLSVSGSPSLYRLFAATSLANAIAGTYSTIYTEITDATAGSSGIGGAGAIVKWGSTLYYGGLGGQSGLYPTSGENGQKVVLTGGGIIYTGAGGGAGGDATYDGTGGGSVDLFNGTSNIGKYGGSGGGFFPGNAYVSISPNVTLYTNTGTNYFYINY